MNVDGKTPLLVEWTVAMRSLGSESGDQYLVSRTGDGGVLVAVADGLGHGPEAASAARTAIAVLEAGPERELGARFLPELNPIATGLAGTTRTSIIRFLCYGAAGALTWAGGWIGLGYLLSHAVTETAVHLGVRLIVLFLGAFALYLPFRRARRHHLIRVLRQAPVWSEDFLAKGWIAGRSGTLDVPATHGRGVSTLTIREGRS
jgi:hypothetical protein